MDSLVTYEYDKVIPSDLSSKTILMIGRASDKFKRFDLGIQAMMYISKEIQDSEMIIISELNNLESLSNLVDNLNLKHNIKFVGYSLNPTEYFHNASLHNILDKRISFFKKYN